MEKNGSNFTGLHLILARNSPQCVVSAPGEQIQMSAVSPCAEEARPGSVRPPLLHPLLQGAHQVDWTSSSHLQPRAMQTCSLPDAYTLMGHLSAHPVFSFLLIYEKILASIVQLLYSNSSFHDWTLILKSVNQKDIMTILAHS